MSGRRGPLQLLSTALVLTFATQAMGMSIELGLDLTTTTSSKVCFVYDVDPSLDISIVPPSGDARLVVGVWPDLEQEEPSTVDNAVSELRYIEFDSNRATDGLGEVLLNQKHDSSRPAVLMGCWATGLEGSDGVDGLRLDCLASTRVKVPATTCPEGESLSRLMKATVLQASRLYYILQEGMGAMPMNQAARELTDITNTVQDVKSQCPELFGGDGTRKDEATIVASAEERVRGCYESRMAQAKIMGEDEEPVKEDLRRAKAILRLKDMIPRILRSQETNPFRESSLNIRGLDLAVSDSQALRGGLGQRWSGDTTSAAIETRRLTRERQRVRESHEGTVGLLEESEEGITWTRTSEKVATAAELGVFAAGCVFKVKTAPIVIALGAGKALYAYKGGSPSAAKDAVVGTAMGLGAGEVGGAVAGQTGRFAVGAAMAADSAVRTFGHDDDNH